MNRARGVALVVFLALLGQSGRGQQEGASPPAVGLVERLGSSVALDVEMYDDSGRVVLAKDIITKPTILTFVYFRCPGICTPLLTELGKMVDKIDLEPGKDYQIVTLSFDHTETPDIAADKRANYLGSLKRTIDPTAWRFFTADSANIRRLTSSAGFYFKRDGKDWAHPATLIILSPEGKITRYIYGIQYLPFDIKMAVIEASDGRVGPTIAKVLNFCYSYDPEARTYALNATRISLVLILALVALFVVVFIVKPKTTHQKGM